MAIPSRTLPDASSYVSRGALKLHAALAAWSIDPAGLVGADLGCSTGGFSHCLIEHGASRVHAVDTAYGQLAWKLRSDERVTVHERTNALHAEPAQAVDLVVIDLGWTPQSRALPAAMRWLRADAGARIVTLIKPHYEANKSLLGPGGVLDDDDAERITGEVLADIPLLGLRVLETIESPVRGGAAGKRRKAGAGNREWLALLARSNCPEPAGE
ncbi:MAG: SAM-dependent methyltransferase [Planctomycetota bacterium]